MTDRKEKKSEHAKAKKTSKAAMPEKGPERARKVTGPQDDFIDWLLSMRGSLDKDFKIDR